MYDYVAGSPICELDPTGDIPPIIMKLWEELARRTIEEQRRYQVKWSDPIVRERTPKWAEEEQEQREALNYPNASMINVFQEPLSRACGGRLIALTHLYPFVPQTFKEEVGQEPAEVALPIRQCHQCVAAAQKQQPMVFSWRGENLCD